MQANSKAACCPRKKDTGVSGILTAFKVVYEVRLNSEWVLNNSLEWGGISCSIFVFVCVVLRLILELETAIRILLQMINSRPMSHFHTTRASPWVLLRLLVLRRSVIGSVYLLYCTVITQTVTSILVFWQMVDSRTVTQRHSVSSFERVLSLS